jgi:hypothetical protein
MVERWRAPVMFLGLSLPDHGYHAPNERFDWGQAAGGIKTFVKYFDEISRIPRSTRSEAAADKRGMPQRRTPEDRIHG